MLNYHDVDPSSLDGLNQLLKLACLRLKIGIGDMTEGIEDEEKLYTATQYLRRLIELIDQANFGGGSVSSGDITDFNTAVDDRISNIIGAAPADLDTIVELANALGNDDDFANTVNSLLIQKANIADLSTVATTGSFNDLSDLPVFYSKFPVWMEENADLNANASGGYQWSLGNGNNVTRGSGVAFDVDTELVAIALVTEQPGAGGTVEVMRSLSYNTDETVGQVVLGQTNGASNGNGALGLVNLGAPVLFTAGQRLNFKTTVGNSATNGCTVIAWMRQLSPTG